MEVDLGDGLCNIVYYQMVWQCNINITYNEIKQGIDLQAPKQYHHWGEESWSSPVAFFSMIKQFGRWKEAEQKWIIDTLPFMIQEPWVPHHCSMGQFLTRRRSVVKEETFQEWTNRGPDRYSYFKDTTEDIFKDLARDWTKDEWELDWKERVAYTKWYWLSLTKEMVNPELKVNFRWW
ncbi:hypothetical protein GYMLUDRAFT_58343 [Collybiopsis luxurians FD-317 M1]|uniref:Uncharacterized protein n=1 Tax=Collybiopsis luxurians FD-317 M1 TaxID=944289 RepID=A0A0D0C3E5_9AGAR|nr:hypothetical protein GYMLUDRAFT_58343 [Collybiopsis luxurians FD-317 M1]